MPKTLRVARPAYVPPMLHTIWHGAAVRCAAAGKLIRNGQVHYRAVNREYRKLLDTYRRLAAVHGRIALDERVPEIVERYFVDAGHHNDEAAIRNIMHDYNVGKERAEQLFNQAQAYSEGWDEPELSVEPDEGDEEMGFTDVTHPRGA